MIAFISQWQVKSVLFMFRYRPIQKQKDHFKMDRKVNLSVFCPCVDESLFKSVKILKVIKKFKRMVGFVTRSNSCWMTYIELLQRFDIEPLMSNNIIKAYINIFLYRFHWLHQQDFRESLHFKICCKCTKTLQSCRSPDHFNWKNVIHPE